MARVRRVVSAEVVVDGHLPGRFPALVSAEPKLLILPRQEGPERRSVDDNLDVVRQIRARRDRLADGIRNREVLIAPGAVQPLFGRR
jgi:hypothetical protein